MPSDSAVTTELEREIRDLRNALTALRERLEHAETGKDDLVRRALADSADERRQLQSTVATLRERREIGRGTRQDAVMSAAANAQDTIAQLRSTVAALRDTLERTTAGAE